jgi:hypothetical protein
MSFKVKEMRDRMAQDENALSLLERGIKDRIHEEKPLLYSHAQSVSSRSILEYYIE